MTFGIAKKNLIKKHLHDDLAGVELIGEDFLGFLPAQEREDNRHGETFTLDRMGIVLSRSNWLPILPVLAERKRLGSQDGLLSRSADARDRCARSRIPWLRTWMHVLRATNRAESPGRQPWLYSRFGTIIEQYFAAKTIELLNANLREPCKFAGLSDEVRSCLSCHNKDLHDTIGKMGCNNCQQTLSKKHPAVPKLGESSDKPKDAAP